MLAGTATACARIPGQQMQLARVFGARVGHNDSLQLREQAHAAGVKISDSELHGT